MYVLVNLLTGQADIFLTFDNGYAVSAVYSPSELGEPGTPGHISVLVFPRTLMEDARLRKEFMKNHSPEWLRINKWYVEGLTDDQFIDFVNVIRNKEPHESMKQTTNAIFEAAERGKNNGK